jgi:hypothetical protein
MDNHQKTIFNQFDNFLNFALVFTKTEFKKIKLADSLYLCKSLLN